MRQGGLGWRLTPTLHVALWASLTVSWVDHTGGLASTSIERRLQASPQYVEVATALPGVGDYLDDGLRKNRWYCYRVRAWFAGESSDYSNEACGRAR